jgi:uncharacterized membrane protein
MVTVIAVVIAVTFGLAFLVVTCAVVALLVRLLPGKPAPEQILNERYARGEIDARQFDEMRQRLDTADAVHQHIA